jgi:tRNA G18 (ribose-2'-O)-methylase SpoU
MQAGNLPVFALLDNIRSLHNVGSIFRTADGVGVQKLFLCGITGTPPRSEIRKAALGAEELVPWEYSPDPLPVVKRLKSEGVRIVALEAAPGAVVYDEVEYSFPLCLVVGHEFHGVRPELLREADTVIAIPMAGTKISLNVAVAFGVAVYHIARVWQRSTKR